MNHNNGTRHDNEAINSNEVSMDNDNEVMNSNNGTAGNPNNNTNFIKTTTEKILGKNGYLFGFRGNIIDWVCTSIYNYYTKHNKKKSGLYRGRFFVYGGIKINITKNIYLDVYYSLLKLIPFYIFDVIIISPNMAAFLYFSLLTFSINIRIYKNFYLPISPIHYIVIKCIELASAR